MSVMFTSNSYAKRAADGVASQCCVPPSASKDDASEASGRLVK